MFNNVSIRNTYQEQVFWIDSSNVNIEGLVVDFDPAFTTSSVNKILNCTDRKSIIKINGFNINGPNAIAPKSSHVTFSNGVFNDFLGRKVNSKFIRFGGLGYDENSYLKFINVDFFQNIPHSTNRWGVNTASGTIEFVDCGIDLRYPCNTFIQLPVPESKVILDNVSIKGIETLRIKSDKGSLLLDRVVSKK